MQFSDITTSVHDVWTFIWPPIVMIGIAYCVIRFILPDSIGGLFPFITNSLKSYSPKIEELRKQLEVYGLGKIIPIASVIILIFFLYLLNGPLVQLASKFPPYLSYQPSSLMEKRASDSDKLLLIRKYPTATSVGEAYFLALEKLDPQVSKSKYNRTEIHYKIQNFIKFALLVAIIILIYGSVRPHAFIPVISRFIVLLLGLCMIWIVSFPFLLFNHEQELHDEWRSIEISLQEDATKFLESPATEEEKNKIKGYSDGSWWSLRIWNSYIFEWSYRTFKEKYLANKL